MLELGSHAPAAHEEVGRLAKELGLGVIAIGDQAGRVIEGHRASTGATSTAAPSTAAPPASSSISAAATSTIEPPTAERADNPAAAAERALARTRAGDWILLKASRGMRLERVLDSMREKAR
jgi:UDP-N-acetylmuramyl pentapeptide synthase